MSDVSFTLHVAHHHRETTVSGQCPIILHVAVRSVNRAYTRGDRRRDSRPVYTVTLQAICGDDRPVGLYTLDGGLQFPIVVTPPEGYTETPGRKRAYGAGRKYE